MADDLYRPGKYLEDPGERFARKYPHHHLTLSSRPHFGRREFFRIAGAGLTGFFLSGPARGGEVRSAGVTTHNTARNCIAIYLMGAMSHVDTLDLKVVSGVTPDFFNPANINGVNWPVGLLPNLANHLNDVAIVRSVSSWALVHSLAQTWMQIARNPAAALGDIAPNVGSVVAMEKEPERRAGQVFPAFFGLNATGSAGPGYFGAAYAAFQVNPPRTGNAVIPNTVNPQGQARFETLYSRLLQYDGGLRTGAPYGKRLSDLDGLYGQARNMMYSPQLASAFTMNAADQARYGLNGNGTSFGNACLLAKQILQADQGTRFIQINSGGWDHHSNIYAAGSLPARAAELDAGLSALLDDLKGSGMLDQTLVLVLGEFGRTTGALSAAGGRDHYLIHSALLAGGGVKGGKVIGATDDTGSNPGGVITEFGWAGSGTTGPRAIRPEDIECTVYSALGIDWTTVRYDDPFGRGFEYVPFAKDGTYGPINELFT